MELELLSAANLLTFVLLYGTKRRIGWCTAYKFRDSVVETLRIKYGDSWFPQKPFKGSGYRTIRINDTMDPDIAYAGKLAGLSADFLHKTIGELIMWVDPNEVSYRKSEYSQICVIYPDKEGNYRAWTMPKFHRDSSDYPESFPENFKISARKGFTTLSLFFRKKWLQLLNKDFRGNGYEILEDDDEGSDISEEDSEDDEGSDISEEDSEDDEGSDLCEDQPKVKGVDILVSMCREWYRAQGIEKEKIDIDDMAEYVSSPH